MELIFKFSVKLVTFSIHECELDSVHTAQTRVLRHAHYIGYTCKSAIMTERSDVYSQNKLFSDLRY